VSGCCTERRAASHPPRRASACLDRLAPALTEVETALDVVNRFGDIQVTQVKAWFMAGI